MNTIQSQYESVFNKDGTVKLCGREACSKLIETCERISGKQEFGNRLTGVMNIGVIKDFYKRLND